MAGISLVTADNWIIAHFASQIGGAVSLFNYAKLGFTAPMAMLAQAAGVASMPFFASLWAKERRLEFATQVADSVSRVACMGLLVASAMVALGKPTIDLVFTGGRFSAAEASLCFSYFAVFSLSVFLWSAQAIYSRAFFAAGNTFTPMVAGTVVTVLSLPIYVALFHLYGAIGLAFASDIGIAMQTLTIAGLLHQRRMVSLAGLDYQEMARCLVAAVASGAAVWAAFSLFGAMHLQAFAAHSRWLELAELVAGLVMWGTVALWILHKAGSALPGVIRKRMRLA
jgi:putative peptidoglycan lipid II flippase